MSIFAYQVFVTVVEKSSFVKAADSMNMTASAVSHSIAKLERDLGLTLFTRNRNGAYLSSEGESILPHVLAVLNGQERLSQEVSHLKGLDSGSIRMATFPSVCTSWLPDIINSFRKLHPGVEVTVWQGNYYEVINWLHSGYADIGFLSINVDTRGLDFVPLYQDRMMCVASADYQPKNKTYVTLEDIQAGPILWPHQSDDIEVDTMLMNNYGLNLRHKGMVESDHCLVTLAEAGLGLALLPELSFGRISHKASVYPVEPAWYRNIILAHLKSQPMSSAASVMHRHIVDFCRNLKPTNFTRAADLENQARKSSEKTTKPL
jgi:Transcriptional regulator